MSRNENDICLIKQALNDWDLILNNHIHSISEMLSSKELIQIACEYNEKKITVDDLGFNIFTIISDLYYRQNFHRDVIFEFLNPKGSHKQGDKFLLVFFEMLGIKKIDFSHTYVEKEYPIDNKRRIDTLILDDENKNAIIIENKMNNACDMYRQIPDYYNYIRSLGYEVISIVYLPLMYNKVPDENGWKDKEKEEIHKCIKILTAFGDNEIINLCDNWLTKCINTINDIDCIATIRQYIKLIKYLNLNNMDNVLLEKFYENLKVGENLKTASSIRNMLNELPTYLATRIQNRYMDNYSPFNKIWRYKNIDTVFEGFTLNSDKLYYKLDVWCNENGYDIYFWNPNDDTVDTKKIFSESVALKNFTPSNDAPLSKIYLHLSFYEEDKLFNIIDTLLKELSMMNH